MSKLLINIALASAIYEEQRNYLDTYYPFVLKTFENKSICTLQDISEDLKAIFGIVLPVHSIKDILQKRNRKIFQIKKKSRVEWEISLAKDGQTELNEIIAKENLTETRLQSFYNSFNHFATEFLKKDYHEDSLEKLVQTFIVDNLVEISTKGGSISGKDETLEGFERDFVLFLAHIKGRDVKAVETFDNLWKGTIVWNELRKDDLDKEALELPKRLNVYVDTNFVFSLLELHNPIINQAAKELYALMKEIPNLQLYILDTTIKELWDLLDVFPQFKDEFYEIEVDSVFYYLKKQGYSATKVEKLKDELIDRLRREFQIHFTETVLLTETAQKWFGTIYDHLFNIRKAINEKRPKRIRKSDFAIEKNAHHDSSVITHNLSQKDRFAKNLENCKSVFLTSSFWLYQNYKKIHSKFEGFSSVILDATLTNILYLKNPKTNVGISIDQVIKVHSNYLIVDQNIWALYVGFAKELLNEDEIPTSDYTRLVSKNQYTQHFLLNTEPDKIDRNKVLEVLDRIKSKEEAKDKRIVNYQKILKRKDDQIQSLIDRIGSLEQNQAKDKFERSKHVYNVDMNNYANDQWNKHLISARRIRKRYIIFIFVALTAFTVAFLIEEILSLFNQPIAINKTLKFLVNLVVIASPFIRSFFEHKKVLQGFALWNKKYRQTEEETIKTSAKEEYKTKYKEPELSDFLIPEKEN